MNINFKCSTNGTGYWSTAAKAVSCVKLEVACDDFDESEDFGELRIYFKSWDVRNDGLIYTDPQFLAELRANLNDIGYSPEAVDDVEYSEQGMQGEDFVSLDVGIEFLTEFRRLTKV